jgi:hypothetical protein
MSIRRIVLVTALAACVIVPSIAAARRLARPAEKTAILAAAFRSHQIAPDVTGRCLNVYVSTVNPNWATVGFRYVPSCVSQAGNGVIIMHRTGGRWRFIGAGSAFSCPLPGHVPPRVKRDLRLVCIPR